MDELRVAQDYGTQQYLTAARTQSKLSLAEGRIARLEDALRACEATDRSRPYEYGECDRNGREPKQGQRWNTPREIARDALKGNDAK